MAGASVEVLMPDFLPQAGGGRGERFANVLALAPPTVPLVIIIMIIINISNPVAQPTCLEWKVLSQLILRTT